MKISEGVITDDPAASLPVGAELRFQSIPIVGDVPPGAAALTNWEYFEGVVLAVSFSDDAHVRVHGSAVMVAPGIALAASHVVEPHLDALLSGRAVANCHGITSHGQIVWSIRKVTFAPSSDIVILGLVLASSLPPDNLFLKSVVSTRTPPIGEDLMICGFRANSIEFDRTTSGVELGGNIWVCRGKVSQRYPAGRDSSMLPWPVLEVSVGAGGGMSGGPVYDLNGNLLGLLCSSIDYGDEQGTSYVSLLWPALAVQFEWTWPSGIVEQPVSLLEMDSRLCTIDRRDALAINRAEGGGHVHYREWE